MPLLTPDLAFLHCPKTGGTWVGKCLHAGPVLRLGTSHEPLWQHREQLDGALVAGTVRDPWTWYPSLYIHTVASYRRMGLYLRWWVGTDRAWEREPTAAGFREWLYAVTHLDPSRQQPDRRWDGLTQVHPDTRLLPGEHGEGLASWRHAYTYGDGDTLSCRLGAVLRTHCLVRDTARLLGARREYLRHQYPRANTRQQRRFSTPTCYSEWYDAEMLGWVADADGWLVALLGGYKPEWAAGRVAA